MNSAGIPILWCAAQVTLVLLAAVFVCGLLRQKGRAAQGPVLTSATILILVLSLFAFSPWPQWTWPTASAGPVAPELSTASPAPAPVKNEPSPASPSSASGQLLRDFATAFWAELQASPEAAHPTRAGWHFPGVVTAIVLTGFGLGLLRLAAGLLAVRWYRRRAIPITDRGARELLDVLCAELSCPREVELRESPELTSAATVGWRRPAVLLPAEWRSWTADELRTVLAHEIAHVRQGDFLSCLAVQLALAMHWLSRRLRLELELAADAAAARVAGGADSYVQTLARLALRQADRPPGWPARTFLPTQGTLLRRIEMLRGPHPFPKAVPLAGRIVAVTVVIVSGLVAMGFRGVSPEQPANPFIALKEQNIAQKEQKPAAPAGEADSRIIAEYVPADTALVAIVRVKNLLHHPVFKSVLAQAVPSAQEELPLPLDQIEQVTVLMRRGDLGLRGSGEQPGTPASRPTVIVKVSRPEAAQSLAKLFGKSEVLAGEGAYEVLVGESGIAWKLATPTTLIFGDDVGVRTVLASGQKPRSRLVTGERWQPPASAQMLVAARSDAVRDLRMTAPRNSPDLLITAPYAPLWEDSTDLFLGISFEKELSFEGTIVCHDAASTERVRETAQALATVLKNSLRGLREGDPRQMPRDLRALMVPLFDPLETLAESTRVRTEGTNVKISARTEVSPEVITPVVQALSAARSAAGRVRSLNNLKQIGLGMHNYADVYKRFPASTVLGPDGKTVHSWRVAILPFVGERDLYQQYNRNEPWDSPNNKKLLDKMPDIYLDPADEVPGKPVQTSSYFMLTGEATLGRHTTEGTDFAQVIDGLSNTLLVVEARRDIPWTKPEDIPFDPEEDLPELGGRHRNAFLAVFGDGAARVLSSSLRPEMLKALITINGGEEVEIP